MLVCLLTCFSWFAPSCVVCVQHLPWLDLLPAGLILHRVPGDHLSMNSKQLMAHWGRLLKAEMEQL